MDNPQDLIRVMPAKGNEFDSDIRPLLNRFSFEETVFSFLQLEEWEIVDGA